jgi:hypothetical protein
LVGDEAVRMMAMAGGGDVDELALWGPVSNVGLEHLTPRIVRVDHHDDDTNDTSDAPDWEDNQHHLSGFTGLKKLEICDTDFVSMRGICSLLSQSSMLTLTHLSLRNSAGKWDGDDESNQDLVKALENLPALTYLDMRSTWVSRDFEKALRARLKDVNLVI